MRDQFITRLATIAECDQRIMLITGDLGFRVLDEYRDRFPAQFLNAGVAEQNMTALAAGLALEGRIVFTYSIANFTILRCLEQIRNDVCYHNLPVKIVSVGGGFSYGALGMSHHATEDLAIMRAIPEMTVVAPGCLWEAAEATTAVVNHPGPCFLRLDKSTSESTGRPGETFRIGRARRLREGNAVTLMATGGVVFEALAAAETLRTEAIEARVISMPWVKPLDVDEIVSAASDTGGIITIEEHVVGGGLGGAVAEVLLEAGAGPVRFYRMGLRGGFATIVGSQRFLREQYDLDAAAVAEAARKLLHSSRDTLVAGSSSS